MLSNGEPLATLAVVNEITCPLSSDITGASGLIEWDTSCQSNISLSFCSSLMHM